MTRSFPFNKSSASRGGWERERCTHHVISAHINAHRQAFLRLYPCTRCIQTKLPYWNPHSVDTQISKSQDPLSVGHHNSLDYKQNKRKSELKAAESRTANEVTLKGWTLLLYFYSHYKRRVISLIPRIPHGAYLK